MNNSLYKQTLKEYENKLTEKEIALNRKKRKLYNQIPRLAEIDDALNHSGIELAKLIQSNPKNANKFISTYKEKTIDLNMEKGELLVKNGFPLDYLQIKYDCTICNDEGFADGKICNCFKQNLINKYYAQSNLEKILQQENFDNFDIRYYSDTALKNDEKSPKSTIENILSKSIQFVKNFEDHDSSLFFYGNPGLGKTFISHCIAKELLDSGKTVIYQTSADLIDIIRKSKFEKNTNSSADMIEKLFTSDLLIIDDLGTENLTEFANNELFNLINKRLLNKNKMLISTNLSIKELRIKYNNRLTSRILGSFSLLKFTGQDIRLIKANII